MNCHSDIKRNGILCIGGINIDWLATSPNNYFPIEAISYSFSSTIGGVIHNIAQNLHDLEHEIHLISVVGNDEAGKTIYQFLQKTGIHHRHVYTINGQATASIVFINGVNGELLLHVARTEIYDSFTPNYFYSLFTEMSLFQTWVVDTDLIEDTLVAIAHNRPQTSKLFGIVTTKDKASRLIPILPYCEGVFLNRTEAAQLLQKKIETESDILNAADELQDKGVPYVFITMGRKGVCANTPQHRGIIPPLSANVQSTLGAGDAFAAVVIDGLLSNSYTIEEIIHRGLTAASFIVEDKSRTYGMLSLKAIEERGLQIV